MSYTDQLQEKIQMQDLMQIQVMNHLEVQDMLISDMLIESGSDMSAQRFENWERLLQTVKQSSALHKAQKTMIHNLHYQLAQAEKSELQRQQAMVKINNLNRVVDSLKQDIII